MGKLLRQDPTAVTAQLSAWLSDQNSPRFWTAFALSIRGLAYEVMDEWGLARLDYIEGLRCYDDMAEAMGKESVLRMESNMNFIRFRLGNLPSPCMFFFGGCKGVCPTLNISKHLLSPQFNLTTAVL